MVELNLVSVKDRKSGVVRCYAVDDESCNAMLASGGSRLDDDFEWRFHGDVLIEDHVMERLVQKWKAS